MEQKLGAEKASYEREAKLGEERRHIEEQERKKKLEADERERQILDQKKKELKLE